MVPSKIFIWKVRIGCWKWCTHYTKIERSCLVQNFSYSVYPTLCSSESSHHVQWGARLLAHHCTKWCTLSKPVLLMCCSQSTKVITVLCSMNRSKVIRIEAQQQNWSHPYTPLDAVVGQKSTSVLYISWALSGAERTDAPTYWNCLSEKQDIKCTSSKLTFKYKLIDLRSCRHFEHIILKPISTFYFRSATSPAPHYPEVTW